jgi:hypothetical protein
MGDRDGICAVQVVGLGEKEKRKNGIVLEGKRVLLCFVFLCMHGGGERLGHVAMGIYLMQHACLMAHAPRFASLKIHVDGLISLQIDERMT